MTEVENRRALLDKIVLGMEKVYQKLIDFKKKNNSDLIILRDGKVVRVKPEEL